MRIIKSKKNFLTTSVFLALTVVLFFLPTGFEGAHQFREAVKCRALVLETDNSRFIDTGLIRTGQQVCRVRFLSGRFKGKEAEGWNMLGGSLSQDKVFNVGDKAQALVQFEEVAGGEIDGRYNLLSVNLIDYYRLNHEILLALAFASFLVIFAGSMGMRSVLSFVISILVLWKILVPLYLKGVNPMLAGLAVTASLTFVIISLVYGFDRRTQSAVCGAMLGVIFSAILSLVTTRVFKIHGAVMAHSESVLYSGFEFLNLTQIFVSSVCVGAAGSIMDLSVDITSAVNEVVRHCPGIARRDAVKSGMAVARAAMGTMTTTLLLAYSGGSVALLMTFMAQGTPLYNILNNNMVSAQIINTVAGSFGLATAAPFTAVCAGVILARGGKKQGTCKTCGF